MAGLFSWLWGESDNNIHNVHESIEIARNEGEILAGFGTAQLISKDILSQSRKNLKNVDKPIERVHILECKPATLSPTTNISLIKRSWLGVTKQVLADAISKLKRTETAIHAEFAPRSIVLRELLATTPRVN